MKTAVIEVLRSQGPPLDDLAREAWLLERAASGTVAIFATSWQGPVVVLGYAQAADTIDLDFCRSASIPVLRRLTGGTGVVHHGDLGVGLALPQTHPWAAGIVTLYDRFLDALEPALRSLGSAVARPVEPGHASRVRSPICFLDQLSDTLLVSGRKAVGCAQTRRRGAVLVHAAILLGLDADLYARVFRVPVDRIVAGLAPAIEGLSGRDVTDAVVRELARALGLEPRPTAVAPLEPRYLEPYASDRWAPLP